MRSSAVIAISTVMFLAASAITAQTQPATTASASRHVEPVPPADWFEDGKIRFVFRSDDAGFCHASNMALERLLTEGTVSAVSVLVNTGWLDETVDILKKHPTVSVGVHVCLNSEWTPYKWGPVLPAKEVPSLVDEWGHFFGTRKDLLAHNPNMEEVEKEIRAQVDLALRKGLKISYLDHHMGAAVTTPEMAKRFEKVAREHKFGISRWLGETQGPVVYSVLPEQKSEFLISEMRKITKPGVYLVVCHTLVKTPEVAVLKDLNVTGPRNMADYRQAELDMLCNPKLKEVIAEKGIEVIGYDALRERFYERMTAPQ